MSTKISDLTSATSLTGAEEVPIVQTGTTKKTTVGDIKSENYSTTEQVVGTWIDNKPIYQITLQATTTSSSTETNIDLTNIIPTFDYILSIDGTVVNTSGMYHPIAYWKSNTDFANIYISASKKIWFQSGSSNGYGTFTLTLKYTKTTD